MADEVKDDLRGDIAAAMEELSGGGGNDKQHAETSESPGGKQPLGSESKGSIRDGGVRLEDAASRARDEAGRFAKAEEGKARETLSLKEKPEAQVAGLKATDASSVAPSPAPAANSLPPEIDAEGKHLPRIPPPMDWKGGPKVLWDRMPRPVREAIVADRAGIEQARSELAPLKELFDANREFLINQSGSVVEAQRQLMQFARMTETVDGSIQLVQHILRAKGIDPSAVFGGQPSQVPAGNQQPDQQALLAQLVDQKLQPILGQFEQQRTQQVVSQIEDFRADPKHPYFNDVAPRIEGLLKAGAAKDLQDAYDQAIWADPTIRQQLMSAQAEEAKRTQAAEAAKATQARSASLRGSPLPGARLNGAGNPNASALDDTRAALAELEGA